MGAAECKSTILLLVSPYTTLTLSCIYLASLPPVFHVVVFILLSFPFALSAVAVFYFPGARSPPAGVRSPHSPFRGCRLFPDPRSHTCTRLLLPVLRTSSSFCFSLRYNLQGVVAVFDSYLLRKLNSRKWHSSYPWTHRPQVVPL